MTPARMTSSSRLVWCVLAGGWSLVFAAPHFYWARGGAGLRAQAAAADTVLQQGRFAIYNLAAGCLGILGALLGGLAFGGMVLTQRKKPAILVTTTTHPTCRGASVVASAPRPCPPVHVRPRVHMPADLPV